MIDEAIEAMGDRNQARSYFKSIARMIHPDKNAHPLASQAFLKVQSALEATAEAKRSVTACFYREQENRASYQEYTACR